MKSLAIVQPRSIAVIKWRLVWLLSVHIFFILRYLLMKMDGTQSCVFSIMCFTRKMYFYFSQRPGKLPCGESIAIDSSGIVIAE